MTLKKSKPDENRIIDRRVKQISDRLAKRKRSYPQKRRDSIRAALKSLKLISSEEFDPYFYYMNKLEVAFRELNSAQELADTPSIALDAFESVIDEIKATEQISERIINNNHLKEIVDRLKQLLYRQENPLAIMDGFIGEQKQLIEACEQRERDLPEFELSGNEVKSIWPVDLNTITDTYMDLLMEADYRIGTIEILKNLILEGRYAGRNPFRFFNWDKPRYVQWLRDDLREFTERMDAIDKIDDIEVKENPRLLVAKGIKGAIDSARNDQKVLALDSNADDQEIEEVSVDNFLETLKKVVNMGVFINRFEQNEKSDYLDRAVRRDAENILAQGNIFGRKETKNKYYYQIERARRLGLLSDENILETMPVEIHSARSTLAYIDYAGANSKEIKVFPSPSKPGEYCILSEVSEIPKTLNYRWTSITVLDSDKKEDYEFRKKMSARDLDFYYGNLKNCGVLDGDMKRCMAYSYDEKTGLYSFYTQKNIRYYENKLFNQIGDARALPEGDDFGRRVRRKPIMNRLYPYIRLYSNDDIIPTLRDLRGNGIDYYIMSSDSGDGMIYIYFPSDKSERVVELTTTVPEVVADKTIDTRDKVNIHEMFKYYVRLDRKEDKPLIEEIIEQ